MRKKRAYGYTRTAVAETSYIQLQTIRIKDHCRTNNIRLVDVFEDNGKSGLRTFQNSGFDEMLARCRKQDKIDAIVVTDLDRISRNYFDLYLITELLLKKGIKLVVLNDLNDSYKEILMSFIKHK